jgi:hypothetical protein
MLALAGCSTRPEPLQVVPEIRVERFQVPPALRTCRWPDGLSDGARQATIGGDLVTVTEAFVACDAIHRRLVAELERRK